MKCQIKFNQDIKTVTLARLYKRRSNCNKLENITFYISTLNSGWYKLRFIPYFLFVGEFNFPSQSMEERRNFGFIAHLLFIRGVPAQWTSSSNTFPMGSLSTLWLIHTILIGWILHHLYCDWFTQRCLKQFLILSEHRLWHFLDYPTCVLIMQFLTSQVTNV